MGGLYSPVSSVQNNLYATVAPSGPLSLPQALAGLSASSLSLQFLLHACHGDHFKMQIRLSLPPQPPFLFLLWTDPTVSRVQTQIPDKLCYILALCPTPVCPRPRSLSCTGLALIAYADQSFPENCSSPLGHTANPTFPGRPSLLLWSFPTL